MIFGVPWIFIAFFIHSCTDAFPSVFDSVYPTIYVECQSIIAVMYINPCFILQYVISIDQSKFDIDISISNSIIRGNNNDIEVLMPIMTTQNEALIDLVKNTTEQSVKIMFI